MPHPDEVVNLPELGDMAEAAYEPSEDAAAQGQTSEKNNVPPQIPTTNTHKGVNRGTLPSSPLDVLGKLKRYYGDTVDDDARSPHDQKTPIVDNLGKKSTGSVENDGDHDPLNNIVDKSPPPPRNYSSPPPRGQRIPFNDNRTDEETEENIKRALASNSSKGSIASWDAISLASLPPGSPQS